jgi:hypothetical protein
VGDEAVILGAAGVEFIEQNGAGPGVCVMKNFGRVRSASEEGALFEMDLPETDPPLMSDEDTPQLLVRVTMDALATLCGNGEDATFCVGAHRRRIVEAVAKLSPAAINARRNGLGPMILRPSDLV